MADKPQMHIKIIKTPLVEESYHSISPFGRTHASIVKQQNKVQRITNANAQYAKNYDKVHTNIIPHNRFEMKHRKMNSTQYSDNVRALQNYVDG